ncbi:MAG: LacI family DNA-binding transcriptional regulator [Aldersonia sp.]|nr:LacI family DNA-binding transcriptional regulator [Aldersonia sp.]
MDDVAARAGVSRTLVSLIFSNKPGAGGETRERVLQAADELGYRPDIAARLLARGRSRTIGVLVDVQQPFQADLVTAIYPLVEAAGYEVILSASAPGRDEHRAIEALLSHRCEGLILLGPQSDADYLTVLADRATVVVVGRRLPLTRFDTVHTADEVGIRQAVDYLVELGHRDIAHVDGGTDPGAAERRDAYVADMRRHGLDDRIRIIPGAHDESAGIAAGRALLRDARLPSAVITGNDRCAVGLMDTLIRADVKVPQDVSIVGFDDTQFSQLSRIDLTTVRQDVDGLAQNAVRLVVRRLEDGSLAPTEKVLDPKFVVRGSTARISAV